MIVMPLSVNETAKIIVPASVHVGRHEGGMMAITQGHPSGWWTVGRHEGGVIAIPVSVNETARTLVPTSTEQHTRRSACSDGR